MARAFVVGIMGGSDVPQDVAARAHALGAAVADRGWTVLTGGRALGVMAAASRGAHAAGGLVIGILPGVDAADAAPDVDIAIVTGLGDARNVVNVLTSDVVVVLPGGPGTLSELAFAVTAKKPVFTMGWDAPPTLAHAVERVDAIDALVARLAAHAPA